jgi:MarR family transcriptional regulator, organic hydroperoxide resistance regulator
MVAAAVVEPRERAGLGPDELVNSVHEMMRSVVHHLQPALAHEGISTGQFWALHLVSSLESASVSTVARHLAVSAPTVCSNIDLLEAGGLVGRHRSDKDRRSVELTLTPKGRRVEARIWGQIGRLMNETAKGLPPEDIATAVRVFRELHRRLEPGDDRSGGRA